MFDKLSLLTKANNKQTRPSDCL